VSENVESKWKDYFSPEEFERDRAKMWVEGWVIVEERTRPGKVRAFYTGGGLFELVLWPIVWLLNKTQPREILLVRYERQR
jgi:hypothetical protein